MPGVFGVAYFIFMVWGRGDVVIHPEVRNNLEQDETTVIYINYDFRFMTFVITSDFLKKTNLEEPYSHCGISIVL